MAHRPLVASSGDAIVDISVCLQFGPKEMLLNYAADKQGDDVGTLYPKRVLRASENGGGWRKETLKRRPKKRSV